MDLIHKLQRSIRRLVGGVRLLMVDEVIMLLSVRGKIGHAVSEEEIVNTLDPRRRALLGLALRRVLGDVAVRYPAVTALIVRDDLSAAVLELGITGHFRTEHAVLHIEVGLIGGGVDIGRELPEHLLQAGLDDPGKFGGVAVQDLRREVKDHYLAGMVLKELLDVVHDLREAESAAVAVLGEEGARPKILSVSDPKVLSVVREPADKRDQRTFSNVPVVETDIELADAAFKLFVDVLPLSVGVFHIGGCDIAGRLRPMIDAPHAGVVRAGEVDLVEPALARNAGHPVHRAQPVDVGLYLLVPRDELIARVSGYAQRRFAVLKHDVVAVVREEVHGRSRARVVRTVFLGELISRPEVVEGYAYIRLDTESACNGQPEVVPHVHIVSFRRRVAEYCRVAAELYCRHAVADQNAAAVKESVVLRYRAAGHYEGAAVVQIDTAAGFVRFVFAYRSAANAGGAALYAHAAAGFMRGVILYRAAGDSGRALGIDAAAVLLGVVFAYRAALDGELIVGEYAAAAVFFRDVAGDETFGSRNDDLAGVNEYRAAAVVAGIVRDDIVLKRELSARLVEIQTAAASRPGDVAGDGTVLDGGGIVLNVEVETAAAVFGGVVRDPHAVERDLARALGVDRAAVIVGGVGDDLAAVHNEGTFDVNAAAVAFDLVVDYGNAVKYHGRIRVDVNAAAVAVAPAAGDGAGAVGILNGERRAVHRLENVLGAAR